MKTVQKIQMFLLIITLFSIVGCSNEGKSSRKTEEEIEKESIIKNRIKNISCDEYSKDSTGNIKSKGTPISYVNYDTLGNIIQKLEFSSSEENEEPPTVEYFTRSYKYSLKGNILKMFDHGSIKDTDVKWIYKYDNLEKHILRETVFNNFGKIYSQTRKQYNKQGYLEQSVIIDNWTSKPICSIQKFSYDREGNLKNEIIEPINGHKQFTKFEYNYNKFGNLSKKIEYEEDDHIIPSSTEYEYDEKGNIISEKINQGDVRIHKYYAYDNKCRLIKTRYTWQNGDSNQDVKKYWIYSYYMNGDKNTKSFYNLKNELLSVFKYTYEFYK